MQPENHDPLLSHRHWMPTVSEQLLPQTTYRHLHGWRVSASALTSEVHTDGRRYLVNTHCLSRYCHVCSKEIDGAETQCIIKIEETVIAIAFEMLGQISDYLLSSGHRAFRCIVDRKLICTVKGSCAENVQRDWESDMGSGIRFWNGTWRCSWYTKGASAV